MNAKQQQSWIYGVVPAGTSLDELDRRDGLPEVWLVEAGDVAAITGRVPDQDAKATRDQALAHARVLEAAVVDGPVIPFRFGNIVPGGDAEVRSELLEPRGVEFAQLLKRFEGKAQLTLKVNYDEATVLRDILAREPAVAELNDASRKGDEVATRDARMQLGELISNAVQALRQEDALRILESLQTFAVAAIDDDLESEFMVLNAPFLVELDRMKEFEDAVEQLAEEGGERMHFMLLGPMPAYNFLDQQELAWA